MGTKTEILQAYPLGTLEVDCERYGRATLLGISSHKEFSLRLQNEAGGKFSMMPDVVKPVLRSFEDLPTPLEDGTVPAKEILLLSNSLRWRNLFDGYVKRLYVEDDALMMEVDGAAFEKESYAKLACLKSHIWGENMKPAVVDYLRRHHFALPVNGKPLVEGTDYIRKEAGHAR